MAKRRLLQNCLWSVIAVLALSSCASKPSSAPAGDGEFSYLAAGGLAYFYADVNLARPILANISVRGIDMTQTGRFLDKVDFLSGAVYPGESPRKLQLHAWKQKGKVPGAGALFLSAKWAKTASPTGGTYYHSDAYGLSVSTQGSHAFVSDGDPLVFDPPVAAPDTLAELRWEAVLLGWLNHAGTPINNFLSAAGIPVRVPTDRVLFGVHRFSASDADGETATGIDDDDDNPTSRPGSAPKGPLYVLRLRIETENPNQARALAALLAFVRVFAESQDINAETEYLETLRPLLANPPSQDGADLAIQTEPMTAGEIALLFNRFAVYSQ
ncbi:MAG: hypothetical protein LBK63_10345 [Treponema sp.]|nr:hypothetical protein [Treponema sp.]